MFELIRFGISGRLFVLLEVCAYFKLILPVCPLCSTKVNCIDSYSILNVFCAVKFLLFECFFNWFVDTCRIHFRNCLKQKGKPENANQNKIKKLRRKVIIFIVKTKSSLVPIFTINFHFKADAIMRDLSLSVNASFCLDRLF